MSAAAGTAPGPRTAARSGLPEWWPLAALTALAAALRLATLGEQSFWYDEAFTVVRDLHPSLAATLRSYVHTENTPPLWYLIDWADSRVLGTGAFAMRLPSALFGTAAVPVAWALGRELSGRRVALLCAALVAVNPLFWWYSQEARAYELFVLSTALSLLFFVRVLERPTRRDTALFALSGALALLTHYFAVFLLVAMVLALLLDARARRAGLAAGAVLLAVCLALLPLVLAQGGHGTQWIGRWPLRERLEAIPQYYLTGYSGAPLGHGIELLVALPILAGVGFGLWRIYEPEPTARHRGGEEALAARAGLARERRGLWLMLAVTAAGILIPLALALAGKDYLAPRNLVGAMVALTAALALCIASPSTARTGVLLGASAAAAALAITIDVPLSPRLQRGNWKGVAHALGRGGAQRVITTVELGQTPLEYYLPGMRGLPAGRSVLVREIDETGYAPLRAGAAEPPAPGFTLHARLNIDGLIVYRFVSPVPRLVSEASLRRHVITLATPEVLVPADASLSA